MDLAQLFRNRKAALEYEQRGSGSTRAMAARAESAGYRISHTQLGVYARGEVPALPSEQTRRAIAAALAVSVEEVTAAALESVAPDVPDGLSAQHALAFLRLTEGRTDEEIRQTLGVVEATLRAMEASRSTVESIGNGPDVPPRS